MSCNASLTDKTPLIKIKKSSVRNFRFASLFITVITNPSSEQEKMKPLRWRLERWIRLDLRNCGLPSATCGFAFVFFSCTRPWFVKALHNDLSSSPLRSTKFFQWCLGYQLPRTYNVSPSILGSQWTQNWNYCFKKSREQKPTRGFKNNYLFFLMNTLSSRQDLAGAYRKYFKACSQCMYTFAYFVSFFL